MSSMIPTASSLQSAAASNKPLYPSKPVEPLQIGADVAKSVTCYHLPPAELQPDSRRLQPN